MKIWPSAVSPTSWMVQRFGWSRPDSARAWDGSDWVRASDYTIFLDAKGKFHFSLVTNELTIIATRTAMTPVVARICLERRLELNIQQTIYRKINELAGLAPFEDPAG